MKNTVLKTAAVTFAVMIIAFSAAVFALSQFAPSIMVDITSELGLKTQSVKYAEKVYKKTGDVEDLLNIVVLAEEAKDYKTVAKYSPVLIKHEDFPNNIGESLSGESLKNYIIGSYFESLIRVSTSQDELMRIADEYYVLEYGSYKRGNPYNALTSLSADLPVEFKAALKAKLEEIKSSGECSDKELQLLASDISLLEV